MFYVIDISTGEVLAGPCTADEVDSRLDRLSETIPTPLMFVQADCESGFGMFADDWMGVA